MKYKIRTTEEKSRIPEIGEVWRHKGHASVYLRVSDDRIRDKTNGKFYSVDLVSGGIMTTSLTSSDFQISSSVVEFEF